MKSGTLNGSHAIVTGGGKGIGRAIADALAAKGARVTVLSRGAKGLDLPYFSLDVDVADEQALTLAFMAARKKNGPTVILINNSGIAESAPLQRTSRELWDRTIATNLTGTFLCCRAALADMLAQKFGRIVNIASTAGLYGAPYLVAYTASKHGVVGLTRALSAELKGSGVTVNAVCPGYTESDMLERTVRNVMSKTGKTRAQARAALAKMNRGGRILSAQEVAAAVIKLCEGDETGKEVTLPAAARRRA